MNGKRKPANCNTWNARKDNSSSVSSSTSINARGGARQACPVNAGFPGIGGHPARKCRLVLLTAAAVLPLLLATAQSAVVYKWVDEKGNVHFDDHPPAQEAEKIIIENKARQDKEYHEYLDRQTKLLEIYQEENQDRQQEMEKTRKEKELRRDNCRLARKNLNSIKTASYLYQATDDPRNPRILSNSERDSATARAEADIKRWCN